MKYFLCVVLFLLGMLAQWGCSTYLSFFGIAPQILLILTVVVASTQGPVPGQCFGFAWGLFLDVLGAHLFGANALGLTVAAYLVGMGRRQMDVSSPIPQIMVVGASTVAYFLFLGGAGIVFARHAFWVGWTAFLFDPLLNCLVAPAAFYVVDRMIDLE